MNQLIEYFYNFSDIRTKKETNSYMFKYNGEIYTFSLLERSLDEIYEIKRLMSQYPFVDIIVENKYGKLVTLIYSKMYILTKKKFKHDIELKNVLELRYVINGTSTLDKSNWIELWSKKIDNIEYQLKHIMNKYPIICRSINYYIGLAENGIAYIRKINNNDNDKVVSHMRISDKNKSNPQNLIIDNVARDIAEYLKYIFVVKKEEYKKIANDILQVNVYNSNTNMYIYGRMFFLTFYFDLYDEILNNEKDEKKILSIIDRADEYEDYIKYIYRLLCIRKKIPNINWV